MGVPGARFCVARSAARRHLKHYSTQTHRLDANLVLVDLAGQEALHEFGIKLAGAKILIAED